MVMPKDSRSRENKLYREAEENPPEYPQTDVLDFSAGNTDEWL
jgi:hypothetical protein